MKALVYVAPKKVEVRDIHAFKQGSDAIRLRLRFCGICGSDIGIFLGTHPRAKPPLVLGHEFVGIVDEDGKKFKKGDRVVAYPLISCCQCRACRTGNAHVCNKLGLIGIDTDGGICEYIYVDEDMLFKVPDRTSDKSAAVTEPLAVIVRSIHQSGFQALDTAVVIGAGPIGMLTGIMLKKFGASKVYISDLIDGRLSLAESFGMIPINSQKDNLEKIVKDGTDNEGCDVLFECSGSAEAALQMTELTRVSGSICMTSVHKQPHPINLQQLNFKEQNLIGTRVYTKEEFKQAVDYTEKVSQDLEKIISHVIPLSESENVFDMIADPKNNAVKVLIDCNK